jgi:steroid 5-alpha reductase family enzyme
MNWFYIWLFLAITLFITWIVAVKQKRGGIVDCVWTFSLGGCSLIWIILNADILHWPRAIILATLSSLWAYRLGTHLFKRIRREKEDERYAKLILHWGDNWKIQLLIFYQIQALASVMLSSAFWTVTTNIAPLGVMDIIAIFIAIFAILGETVADKQLEEFRSTTYGKNAGVCKSGFWRYTRHPNYFFEWLYWCSFIFLSIHSNYWYISLIAPLAIYYFLTKASGIPYAEKQSLARRGNEYRQYQKETSPFFPWFYKKISH